MAGVSQMDDAENTYLRANGVEQANALDVKIFNPPASRSNFMNRYVEEMRGDPSCAIFDACYLNVPREWLGDRFFERAEWFKANKPEVYRNKFLGEVTGTGGELFDNVTEREMSDEEYVQLSESGWVWQGCDFGYEHPMSFMRVAFDRDTDTLYILDEHVQRHAKLADFLAEPEARGWIDAEVICDSAEPDRIAEMREWGWQAVKATKRWAGNRGRAFSWDWLRSRREIVVDPDRCPCMAKELRLLEFERLRDGEYSSRYPDVGEDCVMATIYALNREIMAASEYDF
jgi:phage terminase large subunit